MSSSNESGGAAGGNNEAAAATKFVDEAGNYLSEYNFRTLMEWLTAEVSIQKVPHKVERKTSFYSILMVILYTGFIRNARGSSELHLRGNQRSAPAGTEKWGKRSLFHAYIKSLLGAETRRELPGLGRR